MLANILPLFVAQTWTPVFHSVRTAKNENTQHSAPNHTHLSMLNVMDLINLSITERKHGAAKKTSRGIYQGLLLRKASLTLISSSVLTVRKTIKQIVIHVFIGENVSTKNSIIENNRNSTRIKYSNIAIMLSLSIVFFFFFFYFILFFNFICCLFLNIYIFCGKLILISNFISNLFSIVVLFLFKIPQVLSFSQ